MFLALLACSGPDGPSDGTTPPPPETGETGETGTTDPLGCDDADWLPGAYWLVEISVAPGPSDRATDLAVTSVGEPVVLVNRPDEGSLRLLWREPGDPPYDLPRSLAWTGLDGQAPTGEVLGVASDGGAWVGGALADGRPFFARFDLGSGDASAWALDDVPGAVTAGPVFTDAGTFLLGTVLDPAVGEQELVLWQVDDGVAEVFRWTDLPDGDAAGALVAGALAAGPDGIVLGGGSFPSAGPGGAWLFTGDGAFEQTASLPAAATGGVAGAIRAAAVRGTSLAYAWGAVGSPAPTDEGWIVYEGTTSDPAAAVAVDTDGATETAWPADLRYHPSGALFVGGAMEAGGAPSVPYVRLGIDGGFATTFALPGQLPGRVTSVEIDAGHEAWGLCVFSEDGVTSDAIEILHLNCRL